MTENSRKPVLKVFGWYQVLVNLDKNCYEIQNTSTGIIEDTQEVYADAFSMARYLNKTITDRVWEKGPMEIFEKFHTRPPETEGDIH